MKKCLAAMVLVTLLGACNPQEAVPPATPGASPSNSSATTPLELKVVNWGQKTTLVATPFNVQADGNSGISFEFNQPTPAAEFTASFDGKPLTGVVASGLIMTATIPGDYLANAGSFPVVVEIPALGARLEAGMFEVQAK